MKNKIPVKKNEILEVIIDDLTYQAYGITKVDGFSVFVENTLPGEHVRIRIERVEKRFAFGKVLEILVESKHRVPIKDTQGTRIGTMPLQHLEYTKQLQFKKQLVMDCFSKVMDATHLYVHDTIGMTYPWEYRNKAQIPVRSLKGVLETGFFKRGTHQLVPIENFHIQHPDIDQAILVIRDILRKYRFEAYDETTLEGLIRHIIVRRGHYTKELMIILVTNNTHLPYTQEVVRDILDALPNTVSIVQNVNMKNTNTILGDRTYVLFGEDSYYDELLGMKFKISSKSFYQVNTPQTEVLYSKALEFANITDNDTVVDAYCGIGTITLAAAQHAKHVYGVEVVEDAISMAKVNAEINQIHNTTFKAGKAEDVINQWVDSGLEIDVLIVDPPRAGLDINFIRGALKSSPKRIVYVSCNPVTLARDVKLMVDAGYGVDGVQPVDLFPHTTHVECVILMQRSGVKGEK